MAMSIVPDTCTLSLGQEAARIVVKIRRSIIRHFDPTMQSMTGRELAHHALRKAQTALENARQAVSDVLFAAAEGPWERGFTFSPAADRYYDLETHFVFYYRYKMGILLGEEDPPVLELVADEVVDEVAVFRAAWLDEEGRERANRWENNLIRCRFAFALRYYYSYTAAPKA
ncbi:hypothetical protein N658DRAFT_499431 [Parathielavia hyrcaniae]|uniref:Uncharacterized protein n=1 Tax=Parathielavia hyrcaniae TaxID=113614 RepID=A0AAN6PXC6_9PEZI|nr:hypothetical protein N658DRAFT_499431 [Parathielavia hyrcaniae]